MITVRVLIWWLRWQTRHGSVPWTETRLKQWYALERWRNREVALRVLAMLLWMAAKEAWALQPEVAAEPTRVPQCLLKSWAALAHSPQSIWKVCQRGLGIVRGPWWIGERWQREIAATVTLFAAVLRVLLVGVLIYSLLHQSGDHLGVITATTYYVSPFGSDSNNGQGADPTHGSNKPWLTLAKPLGASGFASGDTCYVAPGIYTESVTVAMTSAVATTTFAGDQANAQGFCNGSGSRIIGGPVVWWQTSPSSTSVIGLAGRDYLSFSDFTIVGDGNITTFQGGSTATSTNITITRIQFLTASNNTTACIAALNTFAVPLVWRITDCSYIGRGSLFQATLPSGSGSDYDADVVVSNCISAASTHLVTVIGTGASAQFGGGVIVKNCTTFQQGILSTQGAGLLSTSIPCIAKNNFSVGAGQGYQAATSGQITEDYNCIYSATARSNVTAGTHSLSSTAMTIVMAALKGYFNFSITRSAMPVLHSVFMGFADSATSTTTDLNNLPRPCGTMTFGDSGTATAGAAATLTDSGKAWGTNMWSGSTTSAMHWMVKITGGTGSGQIKQIQSNTATVLTVDGNWVTNPSTDSTYIIYAGQQATSGKATAGAATSMTDGGAAWAVNQWTGWTLAITAGTGNGQTTTVTSNTATVLTVPTWGTNPDNTSEYKIYRGTDENTVAPAAGAFERGNTMVEQASVTRNGGASALRAIGPAVQDFDIAVDAGTFVISVYTRWDSTYAGTKPQLKILNGTECGVSDDSTTATGSADTWEQLSRTITPARKGVITVRLQANSTATLGFSYFADFTMTPSVNTNGFTHARRGEPLAHLIAPQLPGYSRGRVVNQ